MTEDRYERRTSVCPSCAVGCSLRYDPDADHAVAPDDAVVNHHGRLCPAGRRAFDPLRSDTRLTAPLCRREGELVAVPWETAYERIEQGITELARSPDALAFLGSPRATNEENYLFQKIARLLGTNNVDNRARLCHNAVEAAMADRLGSSAMTNTLSDLRETDVFLVIGANPAERQPVAFDAYVRPALDSGATLITIDPADTQTTRAADIAVAPRPDTDAFVTALLNRFIIDEGLVDERFVRERTTGFERFAASAAAIDVDAYAAAAGVDAGLVRRVARAFGSAERSAIITATGIGACDHEETPTADALIDLLLLTGNFGRRGVGLNLFRGVNNEQGANDVGVRPHTLPGYEDVLDPDARARVAEVWGETPPSRPGRTERDLVRSFGESIRGAFVFGENPAVTKRGTHDVARDLETMEFLVVQEPFVTETVEHADVVLPASAWAEKSGTVTNLDRRVQRVRQLATPPGDAKQDLSILCELGSRLTDHAFAYDGPRAVFEELRRVNPLYAGLTYGEIERGGQRWPVSETGDAPSVLHENRFMSGKKRIRFESLGSPMEHGRIGPVPGTDG